MTNSSYNLHMKELENSFPNNESPNILIDKVLPLPGLPQIINGILFTTQKKEAKRLSFNILFFAMPFCISKLLIK